MRMIFVYDYSKLRGRIVEKFGNVMNFYNTLDITPNQASKKMMGHSGFSQDDITDWANRLEILTNEIGEYFFTLKV